jgi:SAM-dependent methyltransferase
VDFDEYAADYDAALRRGLAVSGESKEYFARERVAWLARRLRELRVRPRSVLDFGCGTGSAIPLLRERIATEEVLGIDDSAASLQIADRSRASGVRFMLRGEFQPNESFDLVFCNGVFHHVAPTERPATVETIRRALRPGGLFALWDNNPWNPGTRYVMSRIPFDRDAVPISSRESRSLLERGGLTVLYPDFLFVFPRPLRWLRGFETRLASWPIGAQYQMLSRRS